MKNITHQPRENSPRKPDRDPLVNASLALVCLSLAFSAISSQGATMVTTNVSGSDWNNVAQQWKTNGTGTAVTGTPVAGNTYMTATDGINIRTNGNGAAVPSLDNSTRLRSPTSAGVTKFPGDMLTIGTNTEFRIKGNADNTTTVNFPGVGGNPGLVVDGGFLDFVDFPNVTITGTMTVPTCAFIDISENGGGGANASTKRPATIAAQISGAGKIVQILNSTNSQLTISCSSNKFSGTWLVHSGYLLGTNVNSLGTNSSIVVDPQASLGLDPKLDLSILHTATVEPAYDVNTSGTLTLNNGGRMKLHQNCCFTAVTIQGTLLSVGTHTYDELANNYPSNFLPGGVGSLTIRPYSTNPPPLPPIILTQPVAQTLYAGRSAQFSVSALAQGSVTYVWQKNGTPLADSGNISGSATSILTVSNVSAADVGNYSVQVKNSFGATPSITAALALATLTGQPYENFMKTNNPSLVAYWKLDETTDPANSPTAFDYWGNFNGTYGIGVYKSDLMGNTVYGPLDSDGFPGFGSANMATLFNPWSESQVKVAPLNLNTNTVTFTAWIKPNNNQNPLNGIIFCRGAGTIAGLRYEHATDANGSACLGYSWNDAGQTINFESMLFPPMNQWSFVSLVVSATNASIYLINPSGLQRADNVFNHDNLSFSSTNIAIGWDTDGGSAAGRHFVGAIDEVAVFNSALSQDQIVQIYGASGASTNFAPSIVWQPANQTNYYGQTVRFKVQASGNMPLSYQWKAGSGGVYHLLTDDGRISGSSTSTLTISNITAADGLDYVFTASNSLGSIDSNPGTLTVLPTGAPEHLTISIQQAGGRFWDNADWSDGNSASLSAISNPGSTYEVLPGARLRTPETVTNAIFPGDVLTLSGDGNWVNNPGTNSITIGELRLKQPTSASGSIYFKKLVMNGGQIDAPQPNNLVGELNILANAPIYDDNGTGYSLQIGAWLTGNGTIEYHGYNQATFQSSYTNTLNITGTSNTFSGKWNVVLGVLLGSGVNSLGTNSITVGLNGALETTYDINNPKGALVLNGRMFLHQNDTFRNVTINGVALDAGIYSFAQLTAAYPTNFPSSWTQQDGSTFSSGSGSITVLAAIPATITTQPASLSLYPGQTARFTAVAAGTPPLSYQWYVGTNGVYVNLVDGVNINGSTTSALTIPSVTAGNVGDYILVVTNPSNSTTSTVATLAMLSPGGPINITLSGQQGVTLYWDTPGWWSDGNPALVSKFSNPGSTYEVLPGGRLRSPEGVTNAIFPGDILTIDGDGNWSNSVNTTIGELRLKQPTRNGSVYFKKLVMNGGQIDAPQVNTLTGELNILGNTPIYDDNATGYTLQIDSWLTGTGTIEYHGYNQTNFQPSYTNTLNITGASNTFSGQWNVVMGVLLGSAQNSLGTNNITVGTNGAFETSYNINSPNATLTLNGQMFLHQYDVFGGAVINGTSLAPGVYRFSDLAAAYPPNFPASWTQQDGSGISTGSGALIVSPQGVAPSITTPPAGQTVSVGATATFSVTAAGAIVTYDWQFSTNGGLTWLSTGGTNSSYTTLATTAADNGTQFRVVVIGPGGIATSSAATLSVGLANTTIAVVSSANPSISGQTVTFTATVSGGTGAFGGAVTFYDGAASLGTINVNAGVATLGTSALAIGAHSITAVYSGDALNNGSTSSVLAQTVNPATVKLFTQFAGGSLTLTWSQGTLLEATNVLGPWTTNNNTSPYTVTRTGSQKFYRVQIQ